MVQYNKYIITKKKHNPLLKLEQKYGKIITYNYDNIKEYNNLSNHLFERKNVVGGVSSTENNTKIVEEEEVVEEEVVEEEVEEEEVEDEEEEEESGLSYSANRGKKRTYKVKTYKGAKITRLTMYQRVKQLKIIAVVCLGVIAINSFSNILYIWKLNGVIYPLLTIIIVTNLYMICRDYLDILATKLSKKKGTIIQRIHGAIDMFVRAIRGLPGIIPYMPRLPDAKPNKQPFKGVRQGLQLLVIDVDIDVNKYKIEINVPSMAFDFINPLAAICCAWDAFVAMIQPVIDAVITPFLDVCRKVYEPIKKAIMWAKNTIIDPIVSVVMSIYRAIMKFVNFFIGLFNTIISAFSWIPGIGDPIDKMNDNWAKDKLKQTLKNKLMDNQMVRQGMGYVRDKKASDAAMAQANKDNASLIASEAGELDLDDAIARARRYERMTPEEREKMLKNMSAEERKTLKQGQKMLKMTEKELEEYCNQRLKNLIPLRYKKLTYANMIPKAIDHVMRNPNPNFSGGKGNKMKSNVKLRESKSTDKWTRDLEDRINVDIYNAERCSEGCKKTFDIENTNITGFVRTFHILKKRYLAEYDRQDRVLFKLKTVKLRNKIKYYNHKCRHNTFENLKENMARCIIDYGKNTVNDIKGKCNNVNKCAKRVIKLHTVLKLKKENPKKYGGILNKKNLKILKKHNLKSSKLVGGWSIPSPWDIIKWAMEALIDAVRALLWPLIEAFKALLKIIKAIPEVLTNILNMISKITNIPQIFKKISSGIKFLVNWIADQMPGFFKIIGVILKNVSILVKWFVTEIIGRGIKIILAIVEFIVELIKTTGKEMNIPVWASKDNSMLKIPNPLEYIVKVLDLPFKKFFETIGDTLKSILKALPLDWIMGPVMMIKAVAEVAIRIAKTVYSIVKIAAIVAIGLAQVACAFFGQSIYELIPQLRGVINPPKPDESARAQALARRKMAYEKKFKLKLDEYTKEINVLIDRQRKFKLAKNETGFKNVTILLKKRAAARDKFKKEGYKALKRMRVK